MSSLNVHVRPRVASETTAAATQPRTIVGTAGLSPRDVALYRQVVQTEIARLMGTRMRALMTPESYAAYDNMIIAAKALNGGTEAVKALPATLVVAKYDATLRASIKAITDVLVRAHFAEGAHRAWWDIVSSFQNLLH